MDDDRPEALADEQPEPEQKPESPEGADKPEDEQQEIDAEAEGEPGEGEGEDRAGEDERPKRRLSGSERWKRKAQALEAQLEAERGRRVSDDADLARLVAHEAGPEPQEKDFQDYFAYERALSAYAVEKRLIEREIRREAKQHSDRQAGAQREAALAYQERCEEFRADAPDFLDVMAAADSAGLKVNSTVTGLILESEKGPLIAYHLAKNPDRVRSLNAMSERQAAKEIGRLEGRLSLPQKKTTQARKPVEPLKGGASPQKDPSKMTLAEYRVWREGDGKAA